MRILHNITSMKTPVMCLFAILLLMIGIPGQARAGESFTLIDFHFEYDPSSDTPIILNLGDLLAMAVVDTPFDLLDAGELGTLPFQTHITAVELTGTETIVLLTRDGAYIKLGKVIQGKDFTVAFTLSTDGHRSCAGTFNPAAPGIRA